MTSGRIEADVIFQVKSRRHPMMQTLLGLHEMLNDSFVIKMHPLRTAMAAPGPRRPSPCFCRRAKMNDVDPHAWLTQTIERIAQGWPISQIDALML
ncbi:hypothetical protein CQ13_37590 [Bradyrhizobium retamae]|uniref:Transposase IS66 C-terminal domain-containing protein n=1 Tax=Bradyrhizobium retamae TaxID=1300035 RepID=A0A0R3MC83_9BRAD|nr:hypothetical protein CQ13_37590 [Bradyrhizobium retamae]